MLMPRRSAAKLGLLVGAGLMYLCDPVSGEQRRRDLLDRLGTWQKELDQRTGLSTTRLTAASPAAASPSDASAPDGQVESA